MDKRGRRRLVVGLFFLLMPAGALLAAYIKRERPPEILADLPLEYSGRFHRGDEVRTSVFWIKGEFADVRKNVLARLAGSEWQEEDISVPEAKFARYCCGPGSPPIPPPPTGLGAMLSAPTPVLHTFTLFDGRWRLNNQDQTVLDHATPGYCSIVVKQPPDNLNSVLVFLKRLLHL